MGTNILIVDDSSLTRAIIAKSIRLSGVAVDGLFQAGDGREGLELLRSRPVELVLTDINMPEMDGVELVRRMRSEENLKEIPVVVISSDGSQARAEQLRGLGISAYLRKPFTPEAFREIITSILHGGETAR